MKLGELKSSLDNHHYDHDHASSSHCSQSVISDSKKTFVYCNTPSKALKIKDLASNVLNQDCPFEKYAFAKDNSNGQVYELVISGLPQDAQSSHIR